jgi:glutamate-1-semialdehyde 2,1-aminomutase
MTATHSTGVKSSTARSRQHEMYDRARASMPGGTNSNFRARGNDTVYVDRRKGGRIWDIDGNEFIDLRLGYGPVILGHADPRVGEAVAQAVSFSLTSEEEVRVAELITAMTGWVDMARMTVSGTEATMHAMRVARAYTGRDKILKFEGQYHGVHDYALISVLPNDVTTLGERDNPVRLTWGRGIPQAITETVIPAPYNDLDVLRREFERNEDGIAAVIVEPVLGSTIA